MTETTIRDVVALVIKIANVDSVSGVEAVDTAARYGGRYEESPGVSPTRPRRSGSWDGASTSTSRKGYRRTIDWARANPWYLVKG